LLFTGLEATVAPPRMEMRPSSGVALVGDTIALRCFAHLQQDGPTTMTWIYPTVQVRCVA